jgi:hypothetical protein
MLSLDQPRADQVECRVDVSGCACERNSYESRSVNRVEVDAGRDRNPDVVEQSGCPFL